MLIIDANNNITLTRGDTAAITLTVSNEGSTYDFSNDLTQLTVKRNTITEEIIFQKTFVSGTIVIDPSDTSSLPYCELVYDVQLITPDDKIYTVITPHKFVIAEEVNFDDE